MKRMIDVEASLERRIEDIIKLKGFRDFQHFANVALENQLTWESSTDDVEIQKNTAITHQTPVLELLKIPSGIDKRIELKVADRPARVLWGQYYRFLPTKEGVRVLANLSRDVLPDVKQFTRTATELAVQLRSQLVKLDKSDHREFGEQLSASFPEKNEKSQKRFSAQQLVYVSRSTMKMHGMLPALKFVNIESGANDVINVGLTRQGWEFAMIRNPVIDDHLPQALSREEVNFLLDHIADNLPEELEHMTIALKAIEDGKQSRDDLNKFLGEYYRQYHSEEMPWTDAVISTMRAGLISRLLELGLVVRKKTGKTVTYSVSDQGRIYIAGVKYASSQ